jgi:uncharacterized protein YjbI with pentapeptide repeats
MRRKTVIAIGGRITPVAVAAALIWTAWFWWRRLALPWDSQMALAIAVIVAAALWGIWWLWWRLPKRQVRGLDIQIHDPKARADTEDNFRKTVGQALGGAAVLIGAGAAYLQFTQQQQLATQQIAAQQTMASDQIDAQLKTSEASRKASQDLLISNQVSKGFEQLAGDKAAMRLGGIYALEGVMNASELYHQPVLEALCAFVRDNTVGKQVNDKPATDTQAALTVIGRRKTTGALGGTPDMVDLEGVHIPKALLEEANLNHALLTGANLTDADLFEANLTDARLIDANLSGANLWIANLADANLVRANLTGVRTVVWFGNKRRGANLSGANLSGAHLSRAELIGADLTRADLRGADLRGADLRDAVMSRADLHDATLDGQAQLDQACGTDAKLPPGLTLKACPSPPVAPPLNPGATP